MSEHSEQAALMEWAELQEGIYPELEMLYAIPNGGQRHIRVAQKLKSEGVKAGVWDLSLDVPCNGYHGLKIEMKFGKNDLTDDQKVWQKRYKEYGYKTLVCWSWLEAARGILEYLGYEISELE